MNPELVELITRAIFALVCIGFLFLVKNIKENLAVKAENGQITALDLLIADFVDAAQQLLKESDPDGTKRKQYVIDCLMAIGVAITDEIDARIEAAVYRQKLEIRKAAAK